jgi:hypothetical protein
VTRKLGPNDAYLWATMLDPLRTANVADPERLSRQLVAIVRRSRNEKRRTFGPGDTVPYDIVRATDLDGDLWVRLGNAVNERDMWRMPGFDPELHEPGCRGCQLTPFLLDAYGPLTEAP